MEQEPNTASYNASNPSPGTLLTEDVGYAMRVRRESALAMETSRRRSRRAAQAREEAYSSRTGLITTLTMARWAIHMAARTEPNPRVRRARENILLDRWRRFSGDLALMPYLRRRVIL